jgi:hypothetical protein
VRAAPVRKPVTALAVLGLVAPAHAAAGERIVMPEFVSTASTPGVTDVRADLARFDGLFGLPSARVQVITRFAGATTPYLANGEEAGDVEGAPEVAPGCRDHGRPAPGNGRDRHQSSGERPEDQGWRMIRPGMPPAALALNAWTAWASG